MGVNRRKLYWLLLYPLLCSLTYAQISGRVIAVSDGDTVTVLDAQKVSYKVRLSGIDAPEKSQPYGNRSKESLSHLAFNQWVTIEGDKKDRYGRTVGKLIAPNGTDLNLEQVEQGMAWHYKHYEKEQSKEDGSVYGRTEEIARENRLGLWADSDPMPPWKYRKEKRTWSK